jgi:diguanylate cyclase (GGDEF)-like protein
MNNFHNSERREQIDPFMGGSDPIERIFSAAQNLTHNNSPESLPPGLAEILGARYDELDPEAQRNAFVAAGLIAFLEQHGREKAEQVSLTDFLTELGNRRYFDHSFNEVSQSVEQAPDRPHTSGLILIDLDYFKEANDLYGHAGGDTVLQRTATAMRKATRLGDVLARLGGDEFAVLLPREDEATTLAVANRLHEEIGIACQDYGVTASVGAVAMIAGRGISSAEYRIIADQALYAAKGSEENPLRNRVVMYRTDQFQK